MSIISNNKEALKNARKELEAMEREGFRKECDAMDRMLDMLAINPKPMTAAQVSQAMGGELSKHEIASNLLVMKHNRNCSRFLFTNVKIPSGIRGQTGIIVKCGTRKATIAELDGNGKVIPNTAREVTLRGSNLYTVDIVK